MKHLGCPMGVLALAMTMGCAPATETPAKKRSADPQAAMVEAVLELAEVKAICREAEAQGARCMAYPEEPGSRVCPPGRPLDDPCLASIYLGANMGTHASRMATFRVDPGTLEVVAVTSLACPILVSLPAWRAQEAASRAGKPEECGE